MGKGEENISSPNTKLLTIGHKSVNAPHFNHDTCCLVEHIMVEW